MIQIFKGREINIGKIQILKNIAYRKYAKEIYDDYFSDIKDVGDLARLHDVHVDMENLIIGTDWFLCYTYSDYYVEILEWVSIDNGNKIQQAAEMMDALKNIFIQNKDKFFIADMRHDTSYMIYSKMLQKGYFKEINDECIIDCAAPEYVNELKLELNNKFNNIKDFLTSSESNNYTEYFKYILHHLCFVLTAKFINKYDKTKDEPQDKNAKTKTKKL